MNKNQFYDIEDEDTDDDHQSVVNGIIDEEMVVAVVAAAAGDDDAPSPRKMPATRLGGRGSASSVGLGPGPFTVYKRLFTLSIALNATGLVLEVTGRFIYARAHATVFAMGNILALTLCRSEAILWIVFWLAVKILGRPLSIGAAPRQDRRGSDPAVARRRVHSACGASSLPWLMCALVRAHDDVASPDRDSRRRFGLVCSRSRCIHARAPAPP
ncbi:hypothetical protein PR202_gb05549 [Eleusine coracana subsp. coracana]|uniref:Uncharacterized protein n=1 Tax=Eleusine coracana subsp. coracana TaxID=191504 RepID=A0AAV5E7B3_ELECO|nr:hypothetical protein PR202_gb05549 [Eleusine coracana subsp. coracana]